MCTLVEDKCIDLSLTSAKQTLSSLMSSRADIFIYLSSPITIGIRLNFYSETKGEDNSCL